MSLSRLSICAREVCSLSYHCLSPKVLLSEELQGEAITSVAAQRQLIRDQVEQRQKEQYISPGIKNQNALPATMVERYYTQLFALNVMGNESHDISIQMHSNRLCMVPITI